MLEILVSLVVLVIGMIGIMALQSATVRGNRTSRLLERAKILAAQTMEDLRGYSVQNPPAQPSAVVTAPDGVTFTRSFTIAAVTDRPNLRMVTVTVTFAEDGDSGQTRGARLQMLRTLDEDL